MTTNGNGQRGATQSPPHQDRAAQKQGATTTPPRGADLTEWVTATTGMGTFGWDRSRTYKLNGKGEWSSILDAAVIFGAERTAAPDPDFPDRADEDDPEGHGAAEGLTDFTVRMTRGGQIREKQIRRMPTSRALDMAMLDMAGASAWLGAQTTRNGKAELFHASLALSEQAARQFDVFYGITGHHVLNDGQRVFVGGTRVITASGASADLAVSVDSRLAGWTFPDPLPEAEVDDGLAEVAALCEVADPRVIVPQLATAWRAMLGVYRDPADPGAGDEISPTTWCSGPSGSGKSGTTAATVNCAGAPGIRYNTLPFKAGPATHGGITGPALERLMFRARDLCIPFDDLDPSVPAAAASAWQSDFLRRLADQKSRAVASGKDGLRDARPPRCLAIASGEPMDGEDSAVNRALNLPFERGTVRLTEIRGETSAEQRMIRARFGTTILCQILADYNGARAMLASQREARRAMFLTGRGDSGPVLRGAGVAAELMATCDVVLALAVRAGAAEWLAGQARETFELAMLDAWRRHLEIIGATSRSRTFIETTQQAILTGAAYLDSATDPGQPPQGREIPAGWRPQPRGQFGTEYQPRGAFIGWLADDGSVYLLPRPATAAAKMLAERSGESWSGTPKTVGETLKADELLVPHGESRDSQRRAEAELPRPLRPLGFGKRAWHVTAEAWAADDNDGPTSEGGPTSAEGGPTSGAAASMPLTCDGPTSGPIPAEGGPMPSMPLTCDGPTGPTSGTGGPTGGPTLKVPPTCDGPTGPTEKPENPRAGAQARDTSAHMATATGISNLGPGKIGADVQDHQGDEDPRAVWLAATFERPDNREHFKASAQRTALDRITTLLDANPDIADKDAVSSLADSLHVLAELEGHGHDRFGGPFLPTLHGRGAWLRPWKRGGLPLAAELATVIEGYGYERDGYRGPVTVLDRNGAWLGTLASVTVAHGGLDHTGECEPSVSGTAPGYYLVTAYPWTEAGIPSPLGNPKPGNQVWIPAPTMGLLAELHAAGRWPDATALDSWTGTPVRLAAWGRLIREQRRYALETHGRESGAYQATKDAVSKAVSMMNGTLADDTTRPVRVWTKCKAQRIDWRHAIITGSAVAMWRTMDRCAALAERNPDLAPIGIRAKDELLIPADAVELFTTQPYPGGTRPPVRVDDSGIALGTFKVKGREDR